MIHGGLQYGNIYDNSNGLWYELHGDYYLPCLVIPEEEIHTIGIWGRKHLQYLIEHRPMLYNDLIRIKAETVISLSSAICFRAFRSSFVIVIVRFTIFLSAIILYLATHLLVYLCNSVT